MIAAEERVDRLTRETRLMEWTLREAVRAAETDDVHAMRRAMAGLVVTFSRVLQAVAEEG
jgi:hypothetical protein